MRFSQKLTRMIAWVLAGVLVFYAGTVFIEDKVGRQSPTFREEEISALNERLESAREENSALVLENEALKNTIADLWDSRMQDESGQVKGPDKIAYLTFDDGPSQNTDRILDILWEYGVPATFFVTGQQGEEADARYRRIIREGHSIGIHTYSHKYSALYSSTDAFWQDFEQMQDHILHLTGVKTRLSRFPGGTSNTIAGRYCPGIMPVLLEEKQDRGLYNFDWNVETGDAMKKTFTKDEMVAFVREQCETEPVVMILAHDCKNDHTDVTVEALPEIIETLWEMGYTFLPVTEKTPQIQHELAP